MAKDEISNFTPVEVESENGKWKPLPEEITVSGGKEPSAADIMPEAQPQLALGKKVMSQQEKAAMAFRHGTPIMVALATDGMSLLPQLAIEAGAAGFGEISARQLERASTDPELDTIWNDIKAGITAAGLDTVVNLGTYGLGKLVTGAARKIFLPREMPPDIEMAQGVLGRFADKTGLRKWRIFKGKKDPFSLTLGQLNNEERGLVTWFESIARGGTGRGVMSGFDARNERKVAEALQHYFQARIKQKTGPEFGVFMKRMLGEVNDPGEVIKPVEAFRAFLYKRFEDALKLFDDPIDGTQLRNFLLESADPDMINIYRHAKTVELLPELTGIETRTVRKTATTTTRSSQKVSEKVSDKTRQNLLKPDTPPKRSFTGTKGTTSGKTQGTTQTTRVSEVLESPRRTQQEVEEAWKNLSPEDADKIIHLFNSYYKKNDEAFNNRLAKMKGKLKKPFDKFVDKNSNLKVARDTANSYFGQKQDALYNATIKAIRESLKEKPSGIAAFLDPLKVENPAIAYDRLQKVKNSFYFSAATPEVKTATGEIVRGMGRQNAIKLYEESIIKPLRHRFVTAASDQFGRLDPRKLMKQVEKIEAEAPEMLTELWGSQMQVNHIKELASTYNTLLSTTPEKSVFIQLKTAAAIGGVAGGAWAFFNGDNPTVGTATGAGLGATVVLISPMVLARALTNPRLTRALTDGLTESNRAGRIAPKLAMAFRKMAEMKVASTTFRDNPSQDAMQFYNFAPVEVEAESESPFEAVSDPTAGGGA